MNCNVDIETALYRLLVASGYHASAHTIPARLERNLPHIHVVRTGGYVSDRVVDHNSIDFDVYANTQVLAMATALELTGWIRELVGEIVGTQCYESEVSTSPYHNPDPRHPTIGRATLKAQITIRTQEVN